MLDHPPPIIDVLSKINKKSCPHKINFHCHTTCSDGSLTPEELIVQASDLRLEHIAVTDHHSVDSIHRINTLINSHQDERYFPHFWNGIEISCLLKGCLVHILAIDFDLNSDYLKPYTKGESVTGSTLQAQSVIKAIHLSKGLSILAHPARYRIDFRTLIDEAYSLGINGIEVWYDYEFSKSWIPSHTVCDLINDYVSSYNLLKTCGTDSHGYSLLSR